LIPGVDQLLRFVVPFDPDDEALRSNTLSPSLTLYLWCRSLLRAAAVVSLSLDLDKTKYQQRLHDATNETLGWWVMVPSPTLGTTLENNVVPVALRPLCSLSFELLVLLALLFQFNRNTRDYLWFRPVSGLLASACLALDTASILYLIFQCGRMHPHLTMAEGLLFEWSNSVATVALLTAMQATNIVAWFVAAHVVLGHDRSDDGDTDGTERFDEISGAGAAGTGVSTYRQNQLIFVRAAIWTGAPPMPTTPIPFRVRMMTLSVVLASCASALVFATQALPVMYDVRAAAWSNVASKVASKEASSGKSSTVAYATNVTTATTFFETWLDHENSSVLSPTEREMLVQLVRSSDSTIGGGDGGNGGATTTTIATTAAPREEDFEWDDPLVMLSFSILVGMVSTMTSWKNESSHYIDMLRGLRSGRVEFTNKSRENVRVYCSSISSMGATGLLGFHIGWHFGVQLLVSSLVSLLCWAISMSVRSYAQLVLPVTFPSGSLELASIAIVSFGSLVMMERFCFGAHRCLRPRHLLSCIELSGLVLYTTTALLLGVPYTMTTFVIRLISHRTPPLIQSILQKAAENYERNNNPIVRLTCALMSRASVGKGLEWDREYLHAEAHLSASERGVNASLRLFWFLVENPHMIKEAKGKHTFGSGLKEMRRNYRILKSFPNMLNPQQFQMLRVSFDMLDSDSDGFVTLRDLRCTAAFIPELLGKTQPQLHKIIQIISVDAMPRNDHELDDEGESDRFSFNEWISFVRHRLFLCDMAHHGPGARDARLYGIELRKLRGNLEGALKIQRIYSSKSLASANAEYQSQADLASSKKSLERSETMMSKAVALSGTISETEMVFWGAKIPERMFETLAERLGCCRPTSHRQRQQLDHQDQEEEEEEEEEVCVKSRKLRPLIRACLGTAIDTRLGDLILDALQGGGEVATIKSLRTSYILSHSTGCRLAHVSRHQTESLGDEMGDETGEEEEQENEEESDGEDPEWTNDDDQGSEERATHNKAEGSSGGLSPTANRPSSKRKQQRRELKNGELGKEKQLLSFVSRSLLPHSF
jgi:hypothetical protein